MVFGDAEEGMMKAARIHEFGPPSVIVIEASDNFGGFSNGVGRKFGTRITFVKK